MTREEILAMEVGERLDAFVAEGVMGIQSWFQYSDGLHPKASPYSTDILAAWKVVEKLYAEELELSLKSYIKNKPGFLCSFAKENVSRGIAGGKTAPEAICKAGLLAKLEEE